MPWVTVKDFDRDVRMGDKVKMDQDCEEDSMEVVFIKGSQFVADQNYGMLELYNKSLNDAHWQVWRETKRWKPELKEEYYIMCSDLRVRVYTYNNTIDESFCVNSENLWKTFEQAQEYADECNKVAERLHEKYQE